MKVYLSILIAIISFFTASNQPEKGGSTVNNGSYGEYGYYLQECNSNCELPSHALAAEWNFSIQQSHEGKSEGQTFSKYSLKQRETTNRCGLHLHRISLLHNSLPAITVSHRHIFLLGRLII